MQMVPWNLVKSWLCNSCGTCCKFYQVVLKFPEWLNIVKNFGVAYTSPSINRFLLGKRSDGSCVFLGKMANATFCSLQHAKPQACKLWPFKVLDQPKYGNSRYAAYHYGNREFFIYVDSGCTGVRIGLPSPDFAYSTIPEIIELALGVRQKQCKSTAVLP